MAVEIVWKSLYNHKQLSDLCTPDVKNPCTQPWQVFLLVFSLLSKLELFQPLPSFPAGVHSVATVEQLTQDLTAG